jgi:hypothetical protein
MFCHNLTGIINTIIIIIISIHSSIPLLPYLKSQTSFWSYICFTYLFEF